MTDTTPMASLFDVLELVEKRPGLYVGYSDAERGDQLLALETLIRGYAQAIHHHGIRDPGWDAYAAFPGYLQERFGWSMSCGPIAAIRSASAGDEDAWKRFWALLWEFRTQRCVPGDASSVRRDDP
jgi:hypothetical protein